MNAHTWWQFVVRQWSHYTPWTLTPFTEQYLIFLKSLSCDSNHYPSIDRSIALHVYLFYFLAIYRLSLGDHSLKLLHYLYSSR